jgi:hypothetical protein
MLANNRVSRESFGYQAEVIGLGGNVKVHGVISSREYSEIFKICNYRKNPGPEGRQRIAQGERNEPG